MRVPFNAVDEGIRVVERGCEPWTVQVETRAPGVLDVERLRAAVGAALARHPMARARQLPPRLGEWRFWWEIPPEPDVDPLRIVDGATDPDFARTRANLYSHAIPLAESPPLRVRLVRHPAGDALMLSVNHAAADGIGSLRILASIVRSYAGADDPIPDVDPLTERTRRASLRARMLPDRIRGVAEFLLEIGRGKTRLASNDGMAADGYGFHHVRLPVEPPAAGGDRRARGPTVNDVLVAALHVTIADWNAAHGRPSGRIGVMVPVNLRPRERRYEIVGNFSSFVSTVTVPDDRRDAAATLAAVTRQTRRIREHHPETALIDILAAPVSLPAWVRKVSADWVRPAFERGMDTAVLSNLGRLDQPLSFAAAGEATEVWFSPPACLPLGLAIGAVTMRGYLHLVLRYRPPILGPADAPRFAAQYLETLGRLW